jgi:hypothetical protein
MAARNSTSISVNGRRLEDVSVRHVARWATNSIVTTSYPAHRHSCAAVDGGLEIRTQPITVAQLFLEGVLTADPGHTVLIKVGKASGVAYKLDVMLREDDPYLQAIAVLRFKAVPHG